MADHNEPQRIPDPGAIPLPVDDDETLWAEDDGTRLHREYRGVIRPLKHPPGYQAPLIEITKPLHDASFH